MIDFEYFISHNINFLTTFSLHFHIEISIKFVFKLHNSLNPHISRAKCEYTTNLPSLKVYFQDCAQENTMQYSKKSVKQEYKTSTAAVNSRHLKVEVAN